MSFISGCHCKVREGATVECPTLAGMNAGPFSPTSSTAPPFRRFADGMHEALAYHFEHTRLNTTTFGILSSTYRFIISCSKHSELSEPHSVSRSPHPILSPNEKHTVEHVVHPRKQSLPFFASARLPGHAKLTRQ